MTARRVIEGSLAVIFGAVALGVLLYIAMIIIGWIMVAAHG